MTTAVDTRTSELIAALHRVAEALREEYEMIELLDDDREVEEHRVMALRHLADLIRVAGQLHPDDCC